MVDAEKRVWKEQMHERKKEGKESLLWHEQKCRHCFIRSGTVPNEVNLTRCVHQNRLNSFTELYTLCVSLLLHCSFSLAFFLLLFESVISLAEHSVYRLVFNTLSTTISSSLCWSAGVDFCVFVVCKCAKANTCTHAHWTPWKCNTPPSALMHFLLLIRTMATVCRVNLYSFVYVCVPEAKYRANHPFLRRPRRHRSMQMCLFVYLI